jgi:hypothetical protein
MQRVNLHRAKRDLPRAFGASLQVEPRRHRTQDWRMETSFRSDRFAVAFCADTASVHRAAFALYILDLGHRFYMLKEKSGALTVGHAAYTLKYNLIRPVPIGVPEMKIPSGFHRRDRLFVWAALATAGFTAVFVALFGSLPPDHVSPRLNLASAAPHAFPIEISPDPLSLGAVCAGAPSTGG